jgi:hypothetical protein
MNVEERLARLERENRRLKVAGLLAVLAVASVILSGQTRVPQRIEAESFVVRNPYGQVVATLGTTQTPGPQQGYGELTLEDTQGNHTVALWPLQDGPQILIFGAPNPDGSRPVKWQAP